MAIKKVRIKPPGYTDIVHPETQADITKYNNSNSELEATNVQSAIDEINAKIEENKTEIVDGLTSTDATKALSAKQGKVLKDLVDSKWVYDEDTIKNVKVNNAVNADTVNGKTVESNVPSNAKFTDTTYSEISTSEIDAGTSSTLRTITGRRVKYVLDKIQGWLNNKVDKIEGKGLSTEDYTSAEKTKLSGIEAGAEVNQNAFSNIKVGTTTIAADSKTDTLELTAGTGITLTPDATNDKVTVSVASAPKLTTARTISLSGDVSGSTSFNGSANVTITATVADDSHNHVISNIDGLQDALDAKETPAGAQAKVDAHANLTNNPHSVTKSQVGLGSVSNYGLATQAEAEAGTSSAKYMTPLRTKQAIDALQAVKSVAGKTGIVTVSKSDVGLGNVDNVKQASKTEFDEHKADYADLKGYIGYTENDIVGVEADFVNSKFTRLAGAINKTPGADFDSINAFGGRKRCILTDDGVVLAYYGEPGYVETGKLTQAITINAVTYPVGTPVQVMVEQPKFYYKVVPLQLEPIIDGIGYHLRKARYYVSDTPKVGFKVHPAFVRNGVEVDKIYLSAYEGSIYDESAGTYLLADEQIADFNADKLSSIAYAKPASGLTQNLTRANTRKLAENRGAGWQQKDVLCASASQMLMMIEYAAFNMQSAIGLGVVKKPSGEGNESELTGATSNLGNASGMADGTNGLVSLTYRGEENFWGNIWKWIDGLNVYIDPDTRKTDAYWAAENFAGNTGSAPYKHVGFNLAPDANGYISAFGWSEECDFLFLPTETLGNSALPVGDRFYNIRTGWQVVLLGGRWSYSLNAGAFCWYVGDSVTHRASNVGGGAVYVPQAS
jgi:hypothetical protein